LTAFQRSSILTDASFVLDGVTVPSGSPQMQTLRLALRSDCLEQGGLV